MGKRNRWMCSAKITLVHASGIKTRVALDKCSATSHEGQTPMKPASPIIPLTALLCGLTQTSALAQSPQLSISSQGNQQFVLAWPATASGYVLESVEDLASVSSWRVVAQPPSL